MGTPLPDGDEVCREEGVEHLEARNMLSTMVSPQNTDLPGHRRDNVTVEFSKPISIQ